MTTTTDETVIRDLLADATTAMADRDAERVVNRYTRDIVQFSLAPPLQQPVADVVAPEGLAAWMAKFEGPIGYAFADVELTIGEDVAFAHGFVRLSATLAGGEESFSMWTRSTVGLRKVDGDWAITHQHDSVPFYMDGSFLAATDLEPYGSGSAYEIRRSTEAE